MIPIFFKNQLDPTKLCLSLTPFTYDFSLHNLSLFITETFEIAMLGLAKIFCHGSRYKRLRFITKVGLDGIGPKISTMIKNSNFQISPPLFSFLLFSFSFWFPTTSLVRDMV